MGTNYYYHPKSNPCPTCGHATDTERLYIGKASAGWVFLLHTIPSRGLITLNAWMRLWICNQGRIVDEYGAPITMEEMLSVILCRSHPKGLQRHGGTYWQPGEWTYDLVDY